MKKLSEINEGFWKSGIQRASQNKMRMEDVVNTNLNSLEPSNFSIDVDEGYFAESDVHHIVDERKEKLFSENEMKGIVNYAKKDKWRLPTYDEIKEMFFVNDKIDYSKFSSSVKYFNHGGGTLKIYYQKGANYPEILIHFGRKDNLPVEYWLEDGYMTIGVRQFRNLRTHRRTQKFEIRLFKEHTNTPKRIRLIKSV